MASSLAPYHAIVVAHTHWDREWYLTFEQFRIRLVHLVDQTIALLERDPHFNYFTLDGQSIVLEDYLAIRPENEARLRALVQNGRLLIGPWYVLPDEFLVSAESIVRNLMLGRRIATAFGPTMDVGYVPDPFGHIAQLPQILAGFGIDSFIFSRGLGNEGEHLGSEFFWQAPDGSVVLAIHQIGWDDRNTGYLNAASLGYPSPWTPRTGAPDVDLAIRQLHDLSQILRRAAHTCFLLVNNGCDHLEPQPQLQAMLSRANAALDDVVFSQGTFPQYIEQVRAAGMKLPAFAGELRRSCYTPLLSGVLSARIHLKQRNRAVQTLLERWAEPFCAIASLETKDYPAAFLWHAWRHLLQNHPHDSICGCSIDEVHAEMATRFAQAQQIGDHLVDSVLRQLADPADRSWLPVGAIPVAVFNALPWPNSARATVRCALPSDSTGDQGWTAVTSDGSSAPCHVENASEQANPEDLFAEISFVARDLPALGYRVYGLVPASPRQQHAPYSSTTIENEYYRVNARPNGTLDVTHKPTGHVVAGAFTLIDQADAGDEYTFSPLPDDVPLTSRAVRPEIRSTHREDHQALELRFDWDIPRSLAPDRLSRSTELAACQVSMRASIYLGVPRIELEIDFHNAASDHLLRLLVPTGIAADHVAAAGHFGIVDRSLTLPDGEGWAEQPIAANHQNGLVSVDNGKVNVALLAGDLPEYEPIPAGDGTVNLALTLLRCVGWLSRDDIPRRPGHAGPPLLTPEAQCHGEYHFRCGLYIGKGDLLRVGAHRQAEAFELAPKAIELAAARPAHSRTSEASFLHLQGEGLMLSAVKRSEDGRWLVVRVFNCASSETQGSLRFPFQIERAVAMRLDETVQAKLAASSEVLTFTAPAGKILTFGLAFV